MTTLVTEPTERELVERSRGGDQDAFRQLYEQHGPLVFRALLKLVGKRALAEDALQETFLRLHGSLEQFDAERPLRPYVLRIATNVGLRLLERRRKQGALELDPEDSAEGAPLAAARKERSELIRDALAALPDEHRAVLLLYHVHGLTQKEIAEALGCTDRTTRNRLRAAATLLEGELGRRGLLDEEVTS